MGCANSKNDDGDGPSSVGTRRSALLKRLSRGSRSRSAIENFRRASFAQPVPVDEPRREPQRNPPCSPQPTTVAAQTNPLRVRSHDDADFSIASRSGSPDATVRRVDAPLVFPSHQEGHQPCASNRNAIHLARGAEPAVEVADGSPASSFILRDALAGSDSRPGSAATMSSSLLSQSTPSPLARSNHRGRSAAILRHRLSSPQ